MVTWPNNTHRLMVFGRTGSGKTIAGLYHLSMKDFDTFPWVIWDTKGDVEIERISRMDGAQIIDINAPEKVGRNGLYIVRPLPHQLEEMDAFLWHMHGRGRVGQYVDEGYSLVPNGRSLPSLNAVLTQGRSKHIPVILLSQRPAWLSGFCYSEASYFQVFALNNKDDHARIGKFTPISRDMMETGLPEFHSLWYEVNKNSLDQLSPVPPGEAILKAFRKKLTPKRLAI